MTDAKDPTLIEYENLIEQLMKEFEGNSIDNQFM